MGQRTVEVSRPSKVLFPDSGITKGELVAYYRRIADVMVPYMDDRPLTLHRFPDGIAKDGFYQKTAPEYFPGWIRRVEVEKEDGTLEQVVCDSPETLVYLADQACITPHIWLSRIDRPHHPDRLIFDLDPSGDDIDAGQLREAARTLRSLLDEIGLRAFLMTTGSRGFHLVVPLARHHDFDSVRDFAQRVAKLAARREPDRLTVELRKKERGARLFIDYLRNGYAQTSVTPYAVRARAQAPVATPIDWSELVRTKPRSYTLRDIFRRLGQRDDPWKELGEESCDLRSAYRTMQQLEGDA